MKSTRTYYVYRVNCDCASYVMVRLNPARPGKIMIGTCGHQLGDMQIELLLKTRVKNPTEAIKAWKAENKP